MEREDIDIAQLSEGQQLALQQFTSVTDQELGAAIPVLERSGWNAQIAISRFFDGDTESPVAESGTAQSHAAPSRANTRRETLLDTITPYPSSSRSHRHLSPAPRITPQSESRVNRQPPFILALMLLPLNFLYSILTKPLGLFAYLFPFLPRMFSSTSFGLHRATSTRDASGRRPLNPRDTASRFVREFEEEYGSNALPFYENGYAQALDMAKRDLKFLLVVLTSPEHDDTASFIRHTLLSQDVVGYLTDPQNQIILWAGNVQDSEAYQVAVALNCTKFPFAALIAHTPQVSSTAMSIVARIVGPMPPVAFVAKLREAVTQHSEALDRARATRASQEAERNLRAQQNSAYERSLAQDRERARKKREAIAAQLQAEKEATEKFEARERRKQEQEQWKRWRVQSMRPEPASDVKDSIRVSVRMPSGARVLRRFAPDVAMEELYAFVECYDLLQEASDPPAKRAAQPAGYEHRYAFRLSSPMPRTVYEPEEGMSIGARVGRNSNLVVESLDDAEAED